MTETKYLIDDEPIYHCDPEKNTVCSKENCFLIGGGCDKTTNYKFAASNVAINLFAPVREVSV